jgi:hypothetical protein
VCFPNKTQSYEIYDYEVYLVNVKRSQREEYLFRKNRKKTLEEIDSEIVEKLDMCHIEIVNGNISDAIIKFKKYLKFI